MKKLSSIAFIVAFLFSTLQSNEAKAWGWFNGIWYPNHICDVLGKGDHSITIGTGGAHYGEARQSDGLSMTVTYKCGNSNHIVVIGPDGEVYESEDEFIAAMNDRFGDGNWFFHSSYSIEDEGLAPPADDGSEDASTNDQSAGQP